MMIIQASSASAPPPPPPPASTPPPPPQPFSLAVRPGLPSSTPPPQSFSIHPLALQKCSRCPYTGPHSSFPPRRGPPGGFLKVCAACMDKQHARRAADPPPHNHPPSSAAASPTAPPPSHIATAAMPLDDFLKLVSLNKTRPFDFDTMISVPPGMFNAGEHLYHRSNRIRDVLAEASDYHWNQKKTKRGGKATVVTYFCAQLEGEQSKSRVSEPDRKSRSRITRYHCGGWLRITIMDDNESLLRIRMTHTEAHPSFPASFRRPPNTSEFKVQPVPKHSLPIALPTLASGSPPSAAVPGSLPVHPLPPGLPAPPVIRGVLQQLHPPPHTAPGMSDPATAAATGSVINGAVVDRDPRVQDDLSSVRSPPLVFFSPAQLSGLKRKFDTMMHVAAGAVPQTFAHVLGAVFDHIERAAAELELDPELHASVAINGGAMSAATAECVGPAAGPAAGAGAVVNGNAGPTSSPGGVDGERYAKRLRRS